MNGSEVAPEPDLVVPAPQALIEAFHEASGDTPDDFEPAVPEGPAPEGLATERIPGDEDPSPL